MPLGIDPPLLFKDLRDWVGGQSLGYVLITGFAQNREIKLFLTIFVAIMDVHVMQSQSPTIYAQIFKRRKLNTHGFELSSRPLYQDISKGLTPPPGIDPPFLFGAQILRSGQISQKSQIRTSRPPKAAGKFGDFVWKIQGFVQCFMLILRGSIPRGLGGGQSPEVCAQVNGGF